MSGDSPDTVLDLSMFRDDVTEFGKDIDQLGREFIRDVVEPALREHPRSLQEEIGPSELGHPCSRWMAHKLAGTLPVGIPRIKWAAAIGTAAHDHLSLWCHAYNERHGVARYLFDLKVFVGYLFPEEKRRPITGHVDVFDVWRAAVLDAKFPGKSQIEKYTPSAEENPQYEAQVHSYGNGIINAGLPVSAVGILRLPRAGDNLYEATWKWAPHDPAKGHRALARAGAIATAVDRMGPAAIPLMPTTEHYCTSCDYFLPNAQDLTKACPGAESVVERRTHASPPASLSKLIA